MKKIAILGSTGSIGTQTLEIVREQGGLEVVALAAGRNAKLMEEQIREFRPRIACMWDEDEGKIVKEAVADLNTKVLFGMEGLLEIATMPEGYDYATDKHEFTFDGVKEVTITLKKTPKFCCCRGRTLTRRE